MEFNANSLSQIFRIPDADYSLEHLLRGHINTTYKILKDRKPIYILQKVNTDVFKNIDNLMNNYQMIVRNFIGNNPNDGVELKIPDIIPCKNDSLYYTDNQSQHWRLITYISGADNGSIDLCEHISYQGGRAFGSFLKGVSGINPASIYEILPDFHSLEKRYNDFSKAVDLDMVKRSTFANEEILFAVSRYQSMKKIPFLIENGTIPLRLVHNDTKLSNVIFAGSGKAVGVVDLDTVMPGSALFDFGDAIRSSANTAAEDEQDLSKVRFDIKLFEAFTHGYLDTAGDLLTKTETELLPDSALLLTYIIGIRFLTDYLNGDIYYQTKYDDHNLIRARVQFRLLSQMESELVNMHKVIDHLMIKIAD